MASRCAEYICPAQDSVDITISAELYRTDRYPNLSENDAVYMESGYQFYRKLLMHDGLMLHASAVAYEGKAYLFSGPCGMGKSTHTRLWQQVFGEKAVVFNDDKPALRFIDGKWYAFGTPWCGKDGINVNMKAALGGICFLRRGEQNEIRRLDGLDAASRIMSQTLRRFKNESSLELMLKNVDRLVEKIPIFEFKNLPIPDSAKLSFETMSGAAKEMCL